jgi:hypothetical protein
VITEISVPGADMLEIWAHPETRSETIYDYVEFYKDAARMQPIGDRYSGLAFPGKNLPPLRVMGSSCYLYFHR